MRFKLAVAVLISAAGIAGYVYTQWDEIVARRRGDTIDIGGRGGPGERRGPPPGAQLDIELFSAPSQTYSPAVVEDDADRTYRGIVAALGNAAAYDPVLSRAAREIAYQSAVIGDSPPEDVLTFLLHAAGAPESHAALFRLSTTSERASALEDSIRGALADAPDGNATLRIGVGEAATPGQKYTRRIIVLLSRRDYEIAPTARLAAPNSTWQLRGRLPPGFSAPTASVLFPDNRLATFEVTSTPPSFALDLPVGEGTGRVLVSIDGIAADGPGKLLQLEVEVGDALPRGRHVTMPPAEPALSTIGDAEGYAFELLAADRKRYGLPALELDAELSRIARGHSIEMRDKGYFAHQSPSTGLAGDRLTAAGYRSVAHAENLAKNDTLIEAESSLMNSVSHRANIVRETFTRAGIGIARSRESGRDAWYVTQLFATPVAAVDGDAAPGDIIAEINDERKRRRLRQLAVDDRLETMARAAAERAAAGETEGLPSEVARKAKRAVRRSVGVSVHVVYGLEQFEPPEVALDRNLKAVGVGVDQSTTDIHGRTGVVVIVSR